jgi:hypothetical protein
MTAEWVRADGCFKFLKWKLAMRRVDESEPIIRQEPAKIGVDFLVLSAASNEDICAVGKKYLAIDVWQLSINKWLMLEEAIVEDKELVRLP